MDVSRTPVDLHNVTTAKHVAYRLVVVNKGPSSRNAAHDSHHWDSTHVPVLFRGRRPRHAAQVGGDRQPECVLYVLDRTTGQFVAGRPYAKADFLRGWRRSARTRRHRLGSHPRPGRRERQASLYIHGIRRILTHSEYDEGKWRA